MLLSSRYIIFIVTSLLGGIMAEVEELYNKLCRYPLQRNILTRLVVLSYNVGDLVKSVYYAIHYGEGIDDPAYRGEIKCALADAYIQLLILIKMLGFSEREIRELGANRLREFLLHRVKK